MKVSVLTVAVLANSVMALYQCNKNEITNAVFRYQVRSTLQVPDTPGICGGLWDNLKRFGECGTPSNTWCGDAGNGILGWDFNAFVGCDNGMVESTWWEATRNNYGSVDCDP